MWEMNATCNRIRIPELHLLDQSLGLVAAGILRGRGRAGHGSVHRARRAASQGRLDIVGGLDSGKEAESDGESACNHNGRWVD